MTMLLRSSTPAIGAGLAIVLCQFAGCACNQPAAEPGAARDTAVPPPAIRAWMDRLTVAHEYDPETGFIVAREVVDLPPLLRDAPPLERSVEQGRREGRPVVVFATADRCAPCQQFKRDALNDPIVIRRLASTGWIATHVEVDREHDAAVRILGSAGIPVTYLIVDGQVVDRLPGQRSAKELLDWISAARTKS